MKERPIIFSGEMVRAILDGRKTQTRRAVKMRDGAQEYSVYDFRRDCCPYGQPGDHLWVRETWLEWTEGGCKETCMYKADDDPRAQNFGPWKSSLFMPRWASRITLEITKVRVERLQDISEEDAKAEGVVCQEVKNSVEAFKELWDSLRAKKGNGWETNPWIWVIEFERVTDN